MRAAALICAFISLMLALCSFRLAVSVLSVGKHVSRQHFAHTCIKNTCAGSFFVPWVTRRRCRPEIGSLMLLFCHQRSAAILWAV